MAKRKNNSEKTALRTLSTLLFLLLLAGAVVLYYLLSPKVSNENSSSPDLKQLASYLNVEGTAVKDSLKVHFIDIGQGDSIFIEFPDGKNMLVDAFDGNATVKNKLTSYINALGVTKINYLLATHQDNDHIDSMPTIFDTYDVEFVFKPNVLSVYKEADKLPSSLNTGKTQQEGGIPSSTKGYYEFLSCINNERNCVYTNFNKDTDINLTINYGDMDYDLTVDFLTPTEASDEKKYEANSYSPILIIEFCSKKIMLTGDATSKDEEYLLKYYSEKNLDVDLLKVGHHGSSSSSDQAFIDRIKPEYAVISSGSGNQHKHPRQNVLNRLQANGTTIYRTDLQGDIVAKVDFKGDIKLTTSKVPDDYNLIYIGGDSISASTFFDFPLIATVFK